MALLLLFACKSSYPTDESEPKAIITGDTFAQAQTIINQIDYLPFAFVENGCFARAEYLSMELAVAQIPSSAQVISACTDDREAFDELLKLKNDIRWNWHVAPMVSVDGKLWIFDPSLNKEPLLRDDWKKQVNSADVPHYFQVNPANKNTLGWGYEERCGQDLGLEKMITSFTELEPFDTESLKLNCAEMWSHIGKLDTFSPETQNLMRKKLIARTNYLWKRLAELGKLVTWDKKPAPALDEEELKKACEPNEDEQDEFRPF